jgi:hypothetical protein
MAKPYSEDHIAGCWRAAVTALSWLVRCHLSVLNLDLWPCWTWPSRMLRGDWAGDCPVGFGVAMTLVWYLICDDN